MMTTSPETRNRKSVPRPRKPRPKPMLSHRLHFPPLGALPGQLTIWMGTAAQDYEIRNLPSDFGIAYTLTKLVPDESGENAEPVTYQVCLDAESGQEGQHYCDCMGNQAHGHCKHVRALLRMLERGELRTVHTEPPETPAAAAPFEHLEDRDPCPF